MKVCSECEGLGWFYSDNGPAPKEYACPECGGSGDPLDDLDGCEALAKLIGVAA